MAASLEHESRRVSWFPARWRLGLFSGRGPRRGSAVPRLAAWLAVPPGAKPRPVLRCGGRSTCAPASDHRPAWSRGRATPDGFRDRALRASFWTRWVAVARRVSDQVRAGSFRCAVVRGSLRARARPMGVVFDGTHRSIGSVELVVLVPYVVLLVNLVHIAIVATLCRTGGPRRARVGARTVGCGPDQSSAVFYAADLAGLRSQPLRHRGSGVGSEPWHIGDRRTRRRTSCWS